MNAIICSCFSGSGEVTVNGKVWRFDFSEMFGPLWLNKDGSERKNQNPSMAVWDAFYHQWYIPKYGEPEFMKYEREINEKLESGELVKIGKNIFPKEMLSRLEQEQLGFPEPEQESEQ